MIFKFNVLKFFKYIIINVFKKSHFLFYNLQKPIDVVWVVINEFRLRLENKNYRFFSKSNILLRAQVAK